MNIVWFSWKDIHHPLAGGAETVTWEIIKRLARDGNNVVLLTGRYPNSKEHEVMEGVSIYRSGNKYSVYMQARKKYKKSYTNWADITIDEMNTIPFLAPTFSKNTKNILFVHQLAREVWFYQMIFPLSLVGYFLEPLYLFFMSHRYRFVATVSNSTKKDLEKYGFTNIHTFPIGMELKPIKKLEPKVVSQQNILILGAIRPMKRTLDAVKAFEFARDKNDKLTLTLIGDASSKYAKKVLEYIDSSRYKSGIVTLGRVTVQRKLEEIQRSDAILVASVKEGWGLIVTEANSQGTPAVGYNVDGIRDSIINGKTGILSTENTPVALAKALNVLLSDTQQYTSIRNAAWIWSKKFTFEKSYRSFSALINRLKD